jgi:hypothetical protein
MRHVVPLRRPGISVRFARLKQAPNQPCILSRAARCNLTFVILRSPAQPGVSRDGRVLRVLERHRPAAIAERRLLTPAVLS